MKATRYFIIVLFIIAHTTLQGQWIESYGIKYPLKIHTDSSIVIFEIREKPLKCPPRKDLTYYWYLNRQIHSNKGGIGGQVLDGPYTRYNRNEALLESGFFKKGLKSGEWKYWDERGNLIRIEPFKKGMMDGKVTIYEKGGESKSLSYRKGKLTGNTKEIDDKTPDNTVPTEPKSTMNVTTTESAAQTDSVSTLPPVSKRRGRSHKTTENTNQNQPPNENQ